MSAYSSYNPFLHVLKADIGVHIGRGGRRTDSGWQTSREWLTDPVSYHSFYCYTVKYGDAPNGGNVSDPCPVTPVIWMY